MAKKLESGWIIEWNSENNKPSPTGKNLIAILDYRMSSDNVKAFIEKYYASMTYTPLEMANAFCGNNRHNPYKVSELANSQHFSCGHNPYNFAKRAYNIVVDNENISYDN